MELWNFARADEMQSLTGDGKKLDAHILEGLKADGVVTEIGGALRKTIDRFAKRFAHIEESMHARGVQMKDSTLEEMDKLWEEAKVAERGAEK